MNATQRAALAVYRLGVTLAIDALSNLVLDTEEDQALNASLVDTLVSLRDNGDGLLAQAAPTNPYAERARLN